MSLGMYTLDLLRRPAWGRWIGTPGNKRVAHDVLPSGHVVSTVFLGLDHNFYSNEGPPVLFETMVFPPNEWTDLDCDRYCTWDEAVAGHKAMVERWLNGKGGYENR